MQGMALSVRGKSSVDGHYVPSNADTRDETVMFRGTQAGLEIHIDSEARFEAVLLALIEKLETSSSFFHGARVTIRFSGAPIEGILADLEAIALKYQLTIASVRSLGDDEKLLKQTKAKAKSDQPTPPPKELSIKVVELVEQILSD